MRGDPLCSTKAECVMSIKILYVAWQDRISTRAWYPIGRLDADHSTQQFSFAYTRGALAARNSTDFQALPSFPNLSHRYEAGELFSFFQNRLLGQSRQDFSGFLNWLGMSENRFDPIEVLALTGGERQTDNLEIFPKIHKDATGHFKCRFFLHGQRYAHDVARARSETFQEGEQLRVCLEFNNPATGHAVQLQTEDYVMVGWAPRYLVDDLTEAATAASELRASIVRINAGRVPANMRILVELVGQLPKGYEPMASEEFRLIGATEKALVPDIAH